jgi:Fanconi-associated nuclease 1
MFEETFYYARKELVDERLAEIRGGRGIEIFQRHDGMYREKKTWCLCVSWDVCSSEDLREILGVCWISFGDFFLQMLILVSY